ncbi:MAG: hypothetical protein ACREV6_06090 [Clostridium sp.]
MKVDILKIKLEATAVQTPKEGKQIAALKEFEKEKALLDQEKLFNKVS